jgi:hypothetical protein
MTHKYFSIFLLFITNLFGMIYLLRFMNSELFYKELLILVLLMWMLAIVIFNFANNSRYKYLVSSLFFALGLINTIYLYFQIKSLMLVLLTAANAFGFVISINNLQLRKRKEKKIIPIRRKEEFVEEKPRIDLEQEFEDYEKQRLRKEKEKRREEKIKDELEREASALERAEMELKEAVKIKKKKEDIEELKREAYILERAEKKVEAIPKKTYGMNEMAELKREAALIEKAEKGLMKTMKSPKAEFVPGRFVASAFASTYHVAKCDWANNIKNKNRIWFNSQKEAEKKGYTAHSCVMK